MNKRKTKPLTLPDKSAIMFVFDNATSEGLKDIAREANVAMGRMGI